MNLNPFHLFLAPRRLRWGLTALCGLLLLAGRTAMADITLRLDVHDGDKVSDVVTVVAHADAPAGIDKVEFRLDDKEPFVDNSTPYEFEWDTIKDTEGAHKLIITAFDSNGVTKRVSVSLVVDNELGLGGDALAQKGLDALANRERDNAVKYSRRALKADPGNITAARLIGQVAASQQDWDKAVAAFAQTKDLDKNADAMRELASYRLQRALLPDNAANFYAELQEVDTLRHKAADLLIAQVTAANTPKEGKLTLENSQAIGDALLKGAHYHEAITEYSRFGLADDAPASVVNRLALATILDGRPGDASPILRPLMLAKKSDAGTRAVYGLAMLRLRKFDDALAAVKPDLPDQNPASLIVAAYAYTMLGKHKDATENARDAVGLAPKAGDAQYALAMATTTSVDADSALNKALALAPFQPGPYLLYAANSAMQRRQDRYDLALNLTDFVLKADPDNHNAKLMQVLIYLQTNQTGQAEPILTAMVKKEHSSKDGLSPDLLMALAVYWNLKGNAAQTQNYLAQARQLDPLRFDSQAAMAPLDYLSMLDRRWHYRADPFLTLATLYPTATP